MWDHERQTDKPERRAPQRFRRSSATSQTSGAPAREHKGKDVNDRGVQKHFDAIEIKLRPAFARLLGKILRQPALYPATALLNSAVSFCAYAVAIRA